MMVVGNPNIFGILQANFVDLYMDSTFDCCPNTFYQCLIIIIFDRATNKYVPILYILMTHKTEELYWHAFSQLVVIPEYFDRQWIPILGSWNIFDDEGKYKELMNRTNNGLESYNKIFNGLFEKKP